MKEMEKGEIFYKLNDIYGQLNSGAKCNPAQLIGHDTIKIDNLSGEEQKELYVLIGEWHYKIEKIKKDKLRADAEELEEMIFKDRLGRYGEVRGNKGFMYPDEFYVKKG